LRLIRGVITYLLLSALPVTARDIYVGKDVPSIAHAIKAAEPGDTIHLEPKVYRDYAGFYGKKGAPGKPITLDGHGATLEGSDPLDPAQWQEVSPGLYSNANVLPRLDEGILARWFFLWNGRMQHMGRTSKGTQTPFKQPDELKPGEWTFVPDPSRAKPDSKQLYGTFYLRLAPGQKLPDAKIAAPMRSAGVQLSGDNAHLLIRNLTATHPYNDGFNIHGDCRDVVFENIRAIECGDDGISAHESAEYRVDGFISRGNSTGICDTVAARTSYRRVFIADCLAFDLYFLDEGRYRLADAIVLSSAQNPFVVTGRVRGRCELEIDHLFFRRVGPPRPAVIEKTATVRARRLTLENIVFDNRGELTTEGTASVAEILGAFGEEMRTEVLRTHASYLPTRTLSAPKGQ
jgi:hypothetical protein